MVKVFISYSSVDRDAAFDLMRLLESDGCDVWLDFFDIKPAEVLEGELVGNLERADLVCILLSPTSVASRWVDYEIEHALARQAQGLLMLPVILRPCAIPDKLAALVGLDATAGFDEEVVRLRLLRAVRGAATVEDSVLLDAGKRVELAQRALCDAADLALPGVAAEIDRVRNEPIREVVLEVGLETFPVAAVVELRLVLDPLWTRPMSWFFARYREGATWPGGFAFPEPPYTDYYKDRRPRIACAFRWFDRVEQPSQHIDGTDAGGRPATFSLSFDGESFQPRGPTPSLPQSFEIPPLQKLVDKDSRFELIVHEPEARTASRVDLDTTDIDIAVTARLDGKEPGQLILFRSRRSERDRALQRSQHIAHTASAIERAALLGLYREPRAARREDRARLHDLLDSEDPVPERDRRTLARLAFGDALLARVRGDHLRMLKRFERTALLLEPIVLGGFPTYSEGVLMYRACASLVGYFLEHDKVRRAADFVNAVGLVAQRLVNLDAAEPDYRRIWAEALEMNAIVHAGTGDPARAREELVEAVTTWRDLWAELPSAARQRDAQAAYARAVEHGVAWSMSSDLPLAEWAAELDPDGAAQDAVAAEIAAPSVPPWLVAADPPKWPTVAVDSPLLRYALRVPQRWNVNPTMQSTGPETMHIYRGPWPSELLIVSLMDKASPGGDMRNWVEMIMATVGFPILEMTEPGSTPKLLEWRDLGKLEPYAATHGLDEVRAYTGFAVLPGAERHMARLYILLARRGTLAWKVTVGLESACLPGTPEPMIVSNDHIRAGAMLGTLQLG